MMNQAKLRERLGMTWVEELHYFESLNSTNQYALDNLARLQKPSLVITENQWAGRGQGNNEWFSDQGSLTFSLVIPYPSRPGWLDDSVPISILVGFSVCQAILKSLGRGGSLEEGQAAAADGEATGDLSDELRLKLKWPNDLMIGERKAGGILVESRSQITAPPAPEKAGTVYGRGYVIGIGLNVEKELRNVPPAIAACAETIESGLGAAPSKDEILLHIIEQIPKVFDEYLSDPSLLIEWDRKLSFLRQRHVAIETPNGRIAGKCLGLAEDGALLVDSSVSEQGYQRNEPSSPAEVSRISSGSVCSWS